MATLSDSQFDPSTPLAPLATQPGDVPWPTSESEGWPTGPPPAGSDIESLVDRLFADESTFGITHALIVVVGGRIVAERYGGVLEHWDRDHETVTASTELLSWSMAKSVLHAAVGVLVADGAIDVDAPAPIEAWHTTPGDPRSEITLDHLLAMRDGLDFAEDYVDVDRSDVIDMLYGSGQHDVAAFATARPLAVPPDTRFNYSSGTTNVVAGAVANLVGRGEAFEGFLRTRLFDPVGMASARPTFDAAGTWVASSYLHATARDFARFGLLYARGGVWGDERILPESWVDHGRRPHSRDNDGALYGSHWWVPGDDLGSFRAGGYQGQSILITPALDLVCVRLGKTESDGYPALESWRNDLVTGLRRTRE